MPTDEPRINVSGLSRVARTLLAPLDSRARESARPDALIKDPRAEELAARLEGRPGNLQKMSELDQLFTIMRVRQFDRYARAFLAAHPEGLVVDIGCGLDTRFYRVDNGTMAWLGIDLPEAIALRRSLLPDADRCETIACSAFDSAWLEAVARKHKPVIFLAEGVFPYFPEADIKPLIKTMAACFPGAGLVFDAISPFSVWLHNRGSSVLKETGARLNWAVRDPRRLEAWGMRLREKWRYFDRPEPRLGLANWLKHLPLMGDMNYVLCYRLGAAREGAGDF